MWNLTIENDATNFILFYVYGDWIENSLDIFSIVEEAFGVTKIFLRNEKVIQSKKKITAKIIQLKKNSSQKT